MAGDRDEQEKTHQATPKRRQEARKKGQIARSRDLQAMLMLLTIGVGLLMFGQFTVQRIFALTRTALQTTPLDVTLSPQALDLFLDLIGFALVAIAPLLVISAVAAVASSLAVGGWVFSFEALQFKPDRLDPIKGLSRVFGPRGVVEMLKAFAKFIVVLLAALAVLYSMRNEVFSLGLGNPQVEVVAAMDKVLLAFILVAASTVVIALIDVPFQIWDHQRKLKMSDRQLRDEMKDTEGKPEVKQRVRQMQQEMAQRRMMEDVPQADVIITNPTHFAVALRYAAEEMDAPRVTAKGADLVASRIRQVATANDVEIIEAPRLARALYFSTEIGQSIPAGLYVAVAQILAYVFQLRQGGAVPVAPRTDKLPIPTELERNPDGSQA